MLRNLYIAVAGVAALGLAAWLHGQAVDRAIGAAVEQDRKTWQDRAAAELSAASIEATAKETMAALANLEIIHAITIERDIARATTARADDEHGRMRNDLAALRRGQGASSKGPATRSLTDVAPALADGLEQCGARYKAVEAVARELSVQVTGLQRYITQVVGPVCIADSSAP